MKDLSTSLLDLLLLLAELSALTGTTVYTFLLQCFLHRDRFLSLNFSSKQELKLLFHGQDLIYHAAGRHAEVTPARKTPSR